MTTDSVSIGFLETDLRVTIESKVDRVQEPIHLVKARSPSNKCYRNGPGCLKTGVLPIGLTPNDPMGALGGTARAPLPTTSCVLRSQPDRQIPPYCFSQSLWAYARPSRRPTGGSPWTRAATARISIG